jgi:hypothetical protein
VVDQRKTIGPVTSGHGVIEHDDIARLPFELGYQLRGALAGTNHFDRAGLGQQMPQAEENGGVVVSQADTD